MWTLVYSGTEKSFADWGLSKLNRRLVSQADDEVTFEAASQAMDAAVLFPFGSSLTIHKDRVFSGGAFSGGTIWFVGRVIQTPRHGSKSDEGIRYRLAGPWWYLRNLVFQQQWYLAVDPTDPASSIVGGYRSHVILNQGINGAKLTTADEISEIVNYAITQGAPMQLDSTLPAINVPMDEQKDVTCSEAIQKQLRWIPDAVTWFDYSVSPPKLYVRRRADLAAVSMDASAGGTIDTLDISSRDDIKVPAVVLKFESTNQANEVTWITVTEQKAPVGATGTEFGALVATIALQGFSTTGVSGSIVTETLDFNVTPPGNKPWWMEKFPFLNDPRVDTTGMTITNIARSGSLNLPRELVKGQIADWMGFSVEEEVISATLSYQLKDGSGNIIGDRVNDPVSIKVTSTNGTTGSYSTVASFSSAEPIPTGLAQALYDALNVLQFDGTLTLVESDPSGIVTMGKVMNLTGGLAAWATMRALVQSIAEDVDSGTTQISFGPPNHLGVDDLIELLRVNRRRFNYTAPTSRTTGEASSTGQVSLGAHLGAENAVSQAGYTETRKVYQVGTFKLELDGNLTRIQGTNITTGEYHGLDYTGVNGDAGASGSFVLSAGDCNGKHLQVREVQVCDAGVTKKMMILASALYT